MERIADKLTYNASVDFGSIAHMPTAIVPGKQHPSEIYGKCEFPIFGALVTGDQIRSILDRYDANTQAKEFVRDAMLTLSFMAQDVRTSVLKNQNLGTPKISSAVYKAPVKYHTSHATITKHITTVTADYHFNNIPRIMNGASVTAMKVSAKIKTISVEAIPTHKTYNLGNLEHIHDFSKPEAVLTQTISYTAEYLGTNVPVRGYDLKIVTVNTGPGRTSKPGANVASWKPKLGVEWYNKLQTVAYDFGNGIPVQYIIDNTNGHVNNTSFIHTATAPPAEVVQPSIFRAIRTATLRYDDPITRGFDFFVNTGRNELIRNSIKRSRDIDIQSKSQESKAWKEINDLDVSPLMGLISTGHFDNNTDFRVPKRNSTLSVIACVGKPFGTANLWVPPVHEEVAPNRRSSASPQPYPAQQSARFNPMASVFEPDDATSIGSMESELDINEIMCMAARPSAFDDSVYM